MDYNRQNKIEFTKTDRKTERLRFGQTQTQEKPCQNEGLSQGLLLQAKEYQNKKRRLKRFSVLHPGFLPLL